jgi:protein gp37
MPARTQEASPGCAHCYAETFAERWRGIPGHPYEQGFELRLWPNRLDYLLKWKRPKVIFTGSMSDLFHEQIISRPKRGLLLRSCCVRPVRRVVR